MPIAGLVVNRATAAPPGDLSAELALVAAERTELDGDKLTSSLLRLHADRMRILARETRLRERFTAAHPHVATAIVPAMATDVHDLASLRRVGELLARTPREV